MVAAPFAATQHPDATRDGPPGFFLMYQQLAEQFAGREAGSRVADPQRRFFGPERRAAETVMWARCRSCADVTRSARAGQAEQVYVIDLCAIGT